MEQNNLIKVWLGDVFCWVDLETQEIYSPKMRKLKPSHNFIDGCDYYRIFFEGNVITKNKRTILRLANEEKLKLEANNEQVLYGENREVH